MAVLIITISVHKTKVFVVNWFKWHKKYNTFLEAPSIIIENVRNVLFRWSDTDVWYRVYWFSDEHKKYKMLREESLLRTPWQIKMISAWLLSLIFIYLQTYIFDLSIWKSRLQTIIISVKENFIKSATQPIPNGLLTGLILH